MTNLTNYTCESVQPIVINGTAIKPNKTGMFCLNDIAKAGGLTGQKADPAQWRTKVAAHYKSMQKLHSLSGRNGKTYGTEQVAIAYAMWVSIDFYDLVVSVFCAVRNDLSISKAVNRKLQLDNHELRYEAEKTGRQANQLKAVHGKLVSSALVANSRLKSLENKKLLTFSDFGAYYGVSQKRLKAFWESKGLLAKTWNGKQWKATEHGLHAGLVNQSSKFGAIQVRISRKLFERYKSQDVLTNLIRLLDEQEL